MDQKITAPLSEGETVVQMSKHPDFTQQQAPNMSQSILSHLPENKYNRMHVVLMGLFILAVVACVSYVLGMLSQKSSDMAVNPYLKEVITPKTTQIIVTPTSDPTANWSNYTNAKYEYSVKYPTTLTPNEQTTYYYYVTFDLPPAGDGSHTLTPYLVSVIPSTFSAPDLTAYNYMDAKWITQFVDSKIGTVLQKNNETFTKLADTIVDGQQATVVDVQATGIHQQRVFISKNNFLYMFLNNYQTNIDLTNFKLFLSTVTFFQ